MPGPISHILQAPSLTHLPPAFTLPFTVPTDAGTWSVIAMLLATTYVYMKTRKNAKRSNINSTPPFSNTAQRKIEHQMTELLVELEQMTRQMNAQLDTRAARLDEMIRQADERIELLQRLHPPQPDQLPPSDALPASGPQLHQPSLPPSPSAEPDPELPEEDLPPLPIPIDPRHAAVYRLADEGRSLGEIAREVNQPAGEVELILALRRRAAH